MLKYSEKQEILHIVVIDFGPYAIRKSSAQMTKLYSVEEIIGKQIVAVINFPSTQIATIQSECRILGAINDKEVTLLSPDKPVENGLRIS